MILFLSVVSRKFFRGRGKEPLGCLKKTDVRPAQNPIGDAVDCLDRIFKEVIKTLSIDAFDLRAALAPKRGEFVFVDALLVIE